MGSRDQKSGVFASGMGYSASQGVFRSSRCSPRRSIPSKGPFDLGPPHATGPRRIERARSSTVTVASIAFPPSASFQRSTMWRSLVWGVRQLSTKLWRIVRRNQQYRYSDEPSLRNGRRIRQTSSAPDSRLCVLAIQKNAAYEMVCYRCHKIHTSSRRLDEIERLRPEEQLARTAPGPAAGHRAEGTLAAGSPVHYACSSVRPPRTSNWGSRHRTGARCSTDRSDLRPPGVDRTPLREADS